MKMDLQRFAGSLTVTVYKDAHMTTASASPSSSLAKDDTVALTITPASGYELDEIEVIEGGVTPEYDEDDGWGFTMGEADVVLYVKSKKDNLYKIVENTLVWVNGSKTELKRNMKLVLGKNGAVVDVESSGSAVTVNADVVKSLVDQGVLIKM
jgi:hypothetical protein